MKNVSFKERVKDFAIKKSRQYQDFFCNYDYLVFSTVFIKKKYYFISANPNNYAHLIGINTKLFGNDFFLNV